MGLGRGAIDPLTRLLAGHGLARRSSTRHARVGAWAEDALWFSSAKDSRKARNLAANPRAVITTDNALEPVVVEGVVQLVVEHQKIAEFAEWVDAKYETSYGVAFFDSEANGCFRLSPLRAFALTEGDFTGSPTRWTFPN